MINPDFHIYTNWAPSEKWIKEMEFVFSSNDFPGLSKSDFRVLRKAFIKLSDRMDVCILEHCPEERRRIYSIELIAYMKSVNEVETSYGSSLRDIKLPIDFGTWWTFEYDPASSVDRMGFVNLHLEHCVRVLSPFKEYDLVKDSYCNFAAAYKSFLEDDAYEKMKAASEAFNIYILLYRKISDSELKKSIFNPMSTCVASKPEHDIDYEFGRLFLLRWQKNHNKNRLEIERRLNILRNHYSNFAKAVGVPPSIVKSRVRNLISQFYEMAEASNSFIDITLSIFSGKDTKYNLQRASSYLSDYHTEYHNIFVWTGRNIFIIDENSADNSNSAVIERLQIAKSLGNIFRVSVVNTLDLYIVPWDLTGLLQSLNEKLKFSKAQAVDFVSEKEIRVVQKQEKHEKKSGEKKKRTGGKKKEPAYTHLYKQRLVGVEGKEFAAIEGSGVLSSFISVDIPLPNANRFDADAIAKEQEDANASGKHLEERKEISAFVESDENSKVLTRSKSDRETAPHADYVSTPPRYSSALAETKKESNSAKRRFQEPSEKITASQFDLCASLWPLPSELQEKSDEDEKFGKQNWKGSEQILHNSVLNEEDWPPLNCNINPENEQDSADSDDESTHLCELADQPAALAFDGNEALLPVEPWVIIPPPFEPLLNSDVSQLGSDEVWFSKEVSENTISLLFKDSSA